MRLTSSCLKLISHNCTGLEHIIVFAPLVTALVCDRMETNTTSCQRSNSKVQMGLINKDEAGVKASGKDWRPPLPSWLLQPVHVPTRHLSNWSCELGNELPMTVNDSLRTLEGVPCAPHSHWPYYTCQHLLFAIVCALDTHICAVICQGDLRGVQHHFVPGFCCLGQTASLLTPLSACGFGSSSCSVWHRPWRSDGCRSRCGKRPPVGRRGRLPPAVIRSQSSNRCAS